MDRQTLSNYGWVVVVTLVLSVMLGLTTPFGDFVSNAVQNTLDGMFATEEKGLNIVNSSTATSKTKLNPTGIDVDYTGFVEGDYRYIPVYEGNPTGADNLEEAREIIKSTCKQETGMTWDEYIIVVQQDFEQSQGMTWEEFAIANNIEGLTFEDMVWMEVGLTEDTFVPSVLSGWNVEVIDKSKIEYGAILESVNGVPITNLTNTFSNCSLMIKIPDIPDGVKNMSTTFSNCSSLTEVQKIPVNVTNMNSAFSNCTALVGTIEIPCHINIISFYNCPATVKHYHYDGCGHTDLLPDGATYMQGGNTLLFEFPDTVTNGDTYTYGDYYYVYNLENYGGWKVFVNDTSKTEYGEILGSINNLPVVNMTWTFYNCANLIKAPSIPNGVKNINYTFFGCSSLTEVQKIPVNVTNMSSTFQNCTALVGTIKIPCHINVTSFYNCPATVKQYHYDDCGHKPAICGHYDFATYNDDIKCFTCDKVYYGDVEHSGIIPEGGTYYVGINDNRTGYYSTATATYNAGDAFPKASTGDVYTYGDYEYRYNISKDILISEIHSPYSDNITQITSIDCLDYEWNMTNEGWGVAVRSTTKSNYGTILDEINGYEVTSLAGTFSDCTKMTTSPKIPETIKYMTGAFAYCTSLSDIPVIPNTVKDIRIAFYACVSLTDASNFVISENVSSLYSTFAYCRKLITAPVIPSNIKNLQYAFFECSSLTGTITVNTNTSVTCCLYKTKVSEIAGDCTDEVKSKLMKSKTEVQTIYH